MLAFFPCQFLHVHRARLLATACAELAADPVMATLISRYPDALLAMRGDPFQPRRAQSTNSDQ